jgi:hypothetical protein
MSKFIIALIATTFTMTAFADNHANHTPVTTPMIGSAPAMAASTQAPKHHTKEMHAKKAKHHARKSKHHAQKSKHHAQKSKHHHNTTMPESVAAAPVTN